MQEPPIPSFESERLQELAGLNILDTPAEDRFDRITRLASKVFKVPYAEINFIDEDRQWTKSSVGTTSSQCARGDSFCAHTMLEEGTTVIPDAREDDRLNELVDKLELAERRARVDSLTRLWNRRTVFELLETEHNRARREQEPLAVGMADIDDFKGINDTYGHPVGDEILLEVADRFRRATRDYDVVGRYGGEGFLVVMINANQDTARDISERIRTSVDEEKFETEEGRLDVSVSLGVFVSEPPDDTTSDEMVNRADRCLYEAKGAGKNQVRLLVN